MVPACNRADPTLRAAPSGHSYFFCLKKQFNNCSCCICVCALQPPGLDDEERATHREITSLSFGTCMPQMAIAQCPTAQLPRQATTDANHSPPLISQQPRHHQIKIVNLRSQGVWCPERLLVSFLEENGKASPQLFSHYCSTAAAPLHC